MVALRKCSVALALLFCTFLFPGAHSPCLCPEDSRENRNDNQMREPCSKPKRPKNVRRAGGVPQLVGCSLCTHKALHSIPSATQNPGVVIHIRNSSMQEVEAGGSEARGHPQHKGVPGVKLRAKEKNKTFSRRMETGRWALEGYCLVRWWW